VTAGRAAGAVTLVLIWTVMATVAWPILREHRAARAAVKRRTLFDTLIPEHSWHRPARPAVRVLPARTAAVSTNPPLAAAPAPVPMQRRIS
jgi:hypothetical protein